MIAIKANHNKLSIVASLCLMTVSIWPTTVAGDDLSIKTFEAFFEQKNSNLTKRFLAVRESGVATERVKAAEEVMEIATAIMAAMQEQHADVRSEIVGGMVGEVVGVSKEHASRPIDSDIDLVGDLYRKYHKRLSDAVSILEKATNSQDQDVIEKEYAMAVLSAAEQFSFLKNKELDSLARASQVAAEWAILFPLLRYHDEAWENELVAAFPEWMKRTQSLKAAEDVCLNSMRPKVAYYIWLFQVSADDAATLTPGSYLEILHRRANASFRSKDFLKGIFYIKSAAQLGDQEDLADAAIRSRFRLAEAYEMYGHSQLAADEMKQIMITYPKHEEYGRAALTRLKNLYEAHLFEAILKEAPELINNEAVANYRPQIMYIAWVVNRRENKQASAEKLQQQLIEDYPSHPLCAGLYFASAMKLLAAGNYSEASRLLEMISERYPETTIGKKASRIQKRIRETGKKNGTGVVADGT